MDKAGFGAIHYIVKKDSHKNKHGLLERLIINGEADVDLTTTFHDGVTGLHLAVEVDKYYACHIHVSCIIILLHIYS